MTSHSLLSPSGAHRWMRCPGSLALEAGIPQKTSKYADDGTRAHEWAAAVLLSTADTVTLAGPVGTPLSDVTELAECVTTYVKAVRDYAEGNTLFVEQRVDFSSVLGQDDAFGTADAVIIAGNEIQIHDLKTGRGVKVDAERNEQLMLYALGALEEFGMAADFQTVRLVIHQPRLDNLSEWALPVSELREWAKAAKLAAAEALYQMNEPVGSLKLNPGEKQCKFCRAKATCPALAAKVHETVTDQFDELPTDEQQLERDMGRTTGTVVALYLGEVDLIEAWCKAVRERAYDLLAEGQDVPGYKLVEGKRGSRKWADEAQAEAALKAMRLKTEEMYDLSLISPTSAEKLHKAGTIGPRQWPKLKDLITQAPGKPSVAPAGDKRPAVSIAARADEFEPLA